MDPNETLRNLRAALARRNEALALADAASERGDFGDESELRTQADIACIDAADAAATLDEWLTNGGFLPEGWAR